MGNFNAAIAYEGIVPVELISFSASINVNSIELKWQTVSELNNLGFEIQRSSENTEWEKIGFVEGNGTSTLVNNYSFSDAIKNVNGKYYYRLKQIDNDGTFEYSTTIEVSFLQPLTFSLEQNYPNPFNPTTTIRFNLPKAENVKLTLYNLLGQKIITLVNEYKEPGVYVINFEASDLNSGMYIYEIEAGSFTQTRKMTLIK